MLYLAAIFLAFFLAFVLFTKRGKQDADMILAAWLVFCGIHLLSFYVYSSGKALLYPSLVVIGFGLPLAQAPFLYLYTKQQTTFKRFRPRDLLHFLPVLFSNLLFIDFFLLPPAQKTMVMQLKGEGYTTQLLINLIAVWVSGIVYISLSLKQLISYRKTMANRFSNTEKINFNWLLYLIIWMGFIWIAVMLGAGDEVIFGAAALFVLWIGYFGIRQVQVFNSSRIQNSILPSPTTTDPEYVKYQKSPLSVEEASLIHERLKIHLSESKSYTDPDLTLDDLARQLAVHPNYLSQVINSMENKNFYDLINEHRIGAFISLLAQTSHRQYTLLSLAYDCGFNSKASFNRNFKKHTGFTPSHYLRQLKMVEKQRLIPQEKVSSLITD